MVGARTQDADNLTGEQLYAVLRSGARNVDDLKLSEAVKVADTFARSHRQTIGGLADILSRSHNFFEPNSSERIITPVGPDFDQDLIFSKRSYVLLGQGSKSNKDKVNLKTLVEATANLRAFKKDDTNALVIDNVNVGVINPLLKNSTLRNDAEVIQLYVASFLLIKDPQAASQLFQAITSNFTTAAARSENALAFLDKQQIKTYEKVVEDLPGQVSDALDVVVSDVEGSWLLKLMEERVVGTKKTYELSEDLIRLSTTSSPIAGISGSTAIDSANFLQRISIYLTGIVAERAANIRKTTLDVVGGTLRTANPSNLDSSYYNNAYHDEVGVGGDRAPGNEAVALKSGPNLNPVLTDSKVGDESKYIVFPVGFGLGPVVVARQSAFIEVTAVLGEELIRDVTIQRGQLDGKDRQLFLAGYSKISKQQLDFAETLEDPTTYAIVRKRETLKTTPNEYEKTTNEALGLSPLDHFKTGQGELTSTLGIPNFDKQILEDAFVMQGFIPRRSFLGGGAVGGYNRPTLDLIRKIVIVDLNFFLFQKFKPVIDEVKSQVNQVVTDSARRKELEDEIDLRATFSLDNFTDIEVIQKTNLELRATGVIVDDYFSFVFMAEAQKTMALQLEILRETLKLAVLKVTDGAGSRAEDVEGSDRELKDIVCQPR